MLHLLFIRFLFETPTLDLPGLLGQWAILGGFAAVIALLINVGKTIGLIKDGQAPNWSLGLNLAGLVVFFLVKVFAPDTDVTAANDVANQLAQAGVIILTVVMQLATSKGTNAAVRGTKVIGKSHSKGVG